jgi:hypothetical protein
MRSIDDSFKGQIFENWYLRVGSVRVSSLYSAARIASHTNHQSSAICRIITYSHKDLIGSELLVPNSNSRVVDFHPP